jgi:hypothetical protein
MAGTIFELSDAVKGKLMKKKEYCSARWPTFTPTVNKTETAGRFKLDTYVQSAKTLRLVADMMEAIVWAKFTSQHILVPKAKGIEKTAVETPLEVDGGQDVEMEA